MIADLEGETLPDVETARKEATALAREMLANSLKSSEDPPESIQVTDRDGERVLIVALSDLLPKSLRR